MANEGPSARRGPGPAVFKDVHPYPLLAPVFAHNQLGHAHSHERGEQDAPGLEHAVKLESHALQLSTRWVKTRPPRSGEMDALHRQRRKRRVPEDVEGGTELAIEPHNAFHVDVASQIPGTPLGRKCQASGQRHTRSRGLACPRTTSRRARRPGCPGAPAGRDRGSRRAGNRRLRASPLGWRARVAGRAGPWA